MLKTHLKHSYFLTRMQQVLHSPILWIKYVVNLKLQISNLFGIHFSALRPPKKTTSAGQLLHSPSWMAVFPQVIWVKFSSSRAAGSPYSCFTLWVWHRKIQRIPGKDQMTHCSAGVWMKTVKIHRNHASCWIPEISSNFRDCIKKKKNPLLLQFVLGIKVQFPGVFMWMF